MPNGLVLRRTLQDQQHLENMKNKHNPSVKLGVIALASILSIGAATAATVSGKDGMSTTTANTQTGYVDSGLPMLAAGVQELSLGGRLNWEDSTAYSFDISYGRFLTANWLVGVQGGITGVDSNRDYRGGIFAEYNFLTGTRWVPFVRAGVNYSHPDQGDSNLLLGVDAGVKYFMRSNLAIFASVGGDWIVTGDGGSDGVAKQIDLGLKFYF